MKRRRADNKEMWFLQIVAEAALANRPLPLHPTKNIQIAIEGAGGVAQWIKQNSTRLRQFNKCMAALSKTKKGKIKIPLKQRIGRWPRELRPNVKGYQRPDSTGGDSIKPSPLSAGMPGNEETDPGPPYKR